MAINGNFQMSAYSFENKKSIPLRSFSFHFAMAKWKLLYDGVIKL